MLRVKLTNLPEAHGVKSVRIRSLFWPVISRIWTEYIQQAQPEAIPGNIYY